MNIFTGRSHTSIVRQTKQNAATLGLSLVILGPHWGPLRWWACNMPILDLEEVGRKQKNNLYRDICMGGSPTSIVRQTKQNAASLGLSLVILGPYWGSPWRWACNMPILDLEEVGRKQENNLYRDIFMGGSPTSIVRQTKQNAATQGVSLVGLGPPWGPLWP